MDSKQPLNSDGKPVHTVLDPSNQQAQYHPEKGAPPQSGYYSGNAAVVSQPAMVTHTMQTQQDAEAPSVTRTVLTIVFSCCVFWLCLPVFGLAAFIVAMVPFCIRSNKTKRFLFQISLGLSITGLVLGIIWIIIVVIVYAVKQKADADDGGN